MLTQEQKIQFNEILEELGENLDISETQFNAAVKSYEAVGNWLSKEDSLLSRYKPEILPQGSFMLGTMIKPVHEKGDLDIDLVCELTGKKPDWTQADLKKIVGDRLKDNELYKELLDDEGRRCWTLEYRKKSKNGDQYHMDILPSIISYGYRDVLTKAFSATEDTDFEKLAIRITDNKLPNYRIETQTNNWLKSNPFGYGRWFFNRAVIRTTKLFSLSEAVQPVPKYQHNKLPLQRVVQILKRHRDMMFEGADNKPISIIITTLASRAYNKQENIIEALVDVVNNMERFIEVRRDKYTNVPYKFIGNPVNDEENFADKWRVTKQKETNFYKWLTQVKADVNNLVNQRGKGLQFINESMQKPFGKELVTKTFSNYGDNLLKRRESGGLKMAAGTGLISEVGRTNIPQHKPFGKNE